MGGQTALNCALDLAESGILEKYNVELIGASREAIRMAEDRELFRRAMIDIGLDCPKAEVVRTLDDALVAQVKVGYPTIIRPSFHAWRQRRRHRLQPRGIRSRSSSVDSNCRPCTKC